MSVSVIALKDCASYTDDYEIGGKAQNLSILIQTGLTIPDGWIIPAEEFVNHLIAHNLTDPLRIAFAEGDIAHCEDLRRSILEMDMHPQLTKALSNIPEITLAVRSSASVEDGIHGSYSGLFTTVLGVDKNHLVDAVKKTWASIASPEAISYHSQVSNEGSNCPAMAVLIMPMLNVYHSGVAFSADPSDGNPFKICISVCRGLGTSIVDGAERGSRYTLSLETLDVIEASIGSQQRGDFLQVDGRIATCPVEADVVLPNGQLHELGNAVRHIDSALDSRVDVEFAFTDQALVILQARSLVNLPPFFPDDPRNDNNLCGLGHHTSTDPLSPFSRDLLTRPTHHPRIPMPPWPMENISTSCVHGRLFAYWTPEPLPIRERGQAFLREMENWDEPEEHFSTYHEWTERVSTHVLPPIRKNCAKLLKFSENELGRMEASRIRVFFEEALDTEYQAYVFYNSPSWSTSHYVEMTETLLLDWLEFPKPPPRVYSTAAEQRAMELIQGVPTLTHARDAELQQVALNRKSLDDFICRWGYSYIIRDEHTYLDRWKSWREDTAPLQLAIEQMQRAQQQSLIVSLLDSSKERAEKTLSHTIQQLAVTNPERYIQRVRLLKACVRFGRAHFHWKDDRDLIWSHAQASLRWILMEIARRLVSTKIIISVDDVFLFTRKELLEFLGYDSPDSAKFSTIADQRRYEQAHLARYTPTTNHEPESPAPPENDVMIGIPTGQGTAEGKAHIVHDVSAMEDLSNLEEGDIIVLIGEGKLGLTMFFSQIAGLVYSSGNGFSHEVNILRELGKPAIVSLGENAKQIINGEILRIDAGKGTVTRLRSS